MTDREGLISLAGSTDTASRPGASAGPVLFFDGVCGLCDRTVTWLFEHDRRHVLRFAPLQGETAKSK